MSRIVERVPSWVERPLIPTLESRVRQIVKEEFGHFEKVIDAKFETLNKTMNSGFEAVNAKVDSLEKRFPMVQELAKIRARLAEVEKRVAAR